VSENTEKIVGRISVLESLRAGRRSPRRLFVLRGATGLESILAAAGAISVEEKDRGELDRLAPDMVHQGVILEVAPLHVFALKEWLEKREPAPDAFLVVLDGIEDPHNFGAIIRTAAACGAAAVLFGKDRAAPLTSAVFKAAAGGVEYIDLIQVTNLARSLEQLKEAGFWAAALEADAKQILWEADLRGRMALVVGSEGHGIRRLVRETCDLEVRIPLTGPITSLNASVSAAIALAECVRQRR
jgi:23S rRNA (guanosine2251-2'-O)-methyltransferase